MSVFTVIKIIDGNTFEVAPRWKWKGDTGTRVRPSGYDATEISVCGGQAATNRLSGLILGKEVDLRTPYKIDRGRLVCDVFFMDRKLAEYFSEYQQ